MKKINERIRAFFIALSMVIIAVAVCWINVGVYVVDGDSMENTLHDGDLVFVLKKKEIEDQAIVVCETTELYLDEKYIIKRYYEDNSSIGLYLLGDNEDNSLDSRSFGEVPRYACKGVAWFGISLKKGLIFFE